jgi:hypothetical protein
MVSLSSGWSATTDVGTVVVGRAGFKSRITYFTVKALLV